MILPEDPEKEALQRQLDARDLATTAATYDLSGSDRDALESDVRTRLHVHSELALPPPPYNPDLVQRALPRWSGVQHVDNDSVLNSENNGGNLPSTQAGLPYDTNPLSYGTSSSFGPYYQPQAQASTSQITLPSSRFQVDDSAQTTDSHIQSGQRSAAQSLLRLPWTAQNRPEQRDTLGDRSLIGRPNEGRRRDKGKRRAGGQARSRVFQGLLVKPGWAWKRWGRKRWLLLLGFIVMLIGATVGGLLGGLSIARGNKPIPKTYSANGSRVVVPFDANGYLAFDPIPDGPPPEDGTPDMCNNFTTLSSSNILRSVAFAPRGQNITYSTFYLDKNASSIFIHSKGDSSSGSIQVIGMDDYTLLEAGQVPDDQVRVDVIMRSGANASESLVCRMKDDTGRQGVGLYTQSLTTKSPDEVVAGDPNLSFYVLVRFASPAEVPLLDDGRELNVSALVDQPNQKIPSFSIDTDQMGVRMGYMKGLASFSNLSITLRRGLISADYVAAEMMTLETQTSSLWGNFNVSESLVMNTTNGGLQANVLLHNPRYEDPVAVMSSEYIARDKIVQPAVEMRAVYAQPPVHNPVGHYSQEGDFSHSFLRIDADELPIQQVKVRAQTTNGPLILKYLSQAPGVVLDSGAYTSNGEASTQMHPAFQGGFLLRSVNGDMRIPESNDLENTDNGIFNFPDPWDEDRRRVIVFDQGNNTTFGQNLTSTMDDSRSPWGYTRGDSVYNKDAGSFQVSGIAMWLTQDEIAQTVNVSNTAIAAALECADQACVGYAAMRNSKSVTQTSWGGGELTFS